MTDKDVVDRDVLNVGIRRRKNKYFREILPRKMKEAKSYMRKKVRPMRRSLAEGSPSQIIGICLGEVEELVYDIYIPRLQ